MLNLIRLLGELGLTTDREGRKWLLSAVAVYVALVAPIDDLIRAILGA